MKGGTHNSCAADCITIGNCNWRHPGPGALPGALLPVASGAWAQARVAPRPARPPALPRIGLFCICRTASPLGDEYLPGWASAAKVGTRQAACTAAGRRMTRTCCWTGDVAAAGRHASPPPRPCRAPRRKGRLLSRCALPHSPASPCRNGKLRPPPHQVAHSVPAVRQALVPRPEEHLQFLRLPCVQDQEV
jgi:hypothetical protein